MRVSFTDSDRHLASEHMVGGTGPSQTSARALLRRSPAVPAAERPEGHATVGQVSHLQVATS